MISPWKYSIYLFSLTVTVVFPISCCVNASSGCNALVRFIHGHRTPPVFFMKLLSRCSRVCGWWDSRGASPGPGCGHACLHFKCFNTASQCEEIFLLFNVNFKKSHLRKILMCSVAHRIFPLLWVVISFFFFFCSWLVNGSGCKPLNDVHISFAPSKQAAISSYMFWEWIYIVLLKMGPGRWGM